MNIILFEPGELAAPLPFGDPRVTHLRKVLKRSPGEAFDAGIIDGARGKARIMETTGDGLILEFEPWGAVPEPEPIALLVGLPRPQTARKILREATSLGVGRIEFVLTSRGDPAYAESSLWSSGEYRRHLIAGTEQAFTTRLPALSHGQTLEEAIAGLDREMTRLALDNYEATAMLSDAPLTGDRAALAIGSERGWTKPERNTLRQAGFQLVSLGDRVLRTETAVVAGLAILRARMGI